MNAQLEGCISRLQEMNDALQICTQSLQQATSDFPRLQSVSVLKRDYELVTEAEMRAAKDQVADQDILCALEVERDHIATKLDEPMPVQTTPVKRTPIAKPGSSVCNSDKEQEMSIAFEPKEHRSSEDIQKDQDHYQQLKEEYELLSRHASRKSFSKENTAQPTTSVNRPSLDRARKLKVYQQQSAWLKQQHEHNNVKLPINEFMEWHKTLDSEYNDLKADEINTATEQRVLAIKQCKARLKLFFPQRSMGNTMGRLLELLIDTNDKQIILRTLEEEFPPAKEARHGLTQAIDRLKALGLIEP
ncbi:hypothetical protein BDF19DRAFT_424472 [Syncephalis fuscata]|nr:hypothetical protein BDF19DRAFT_424472 [Syncephalis fuscata]